LGLNGATGKPLGSIGEEQYGAEYSQPVETFGKRGKRIRVAESSIGIAEADLQQRSTQLAYEITAAYAEVSAERHKLKLLSDLIGLNQDTLRLTEARVKEGDVAPLEASLLKVEISRAEVSRRSAQGRLTSAELELRRLIGLDQSVRIPDSDTPAQAPTDSDTLKQDALANRGDLKTARLEEEQEAAGIDLAKAEAKPDVTISAGYARQDNQFDGLFGFNNSGVLSPLRDRDNILTFGVSIPLRTSRSGAGNVQAAAARTAGARLRREYLERNIPLEVEAAYQRWHTASESLQILQSGVLDPSTSNLSIIREAYKLGQLRLLDVLNEQRRLVDTQLAYIDAQADVARTWAEVERAAGGIHP
jgi:outer membrane protein, heavy metal efflux system